MFTWGASKTNTKTLPSDSISMQTALPLHNTNVYGLKELYVRTGIGPSVEHVVQHSIMVHIKPVSYVSQSVWTTGTTQIQVKDNVKEKNKTKIYWYTPEQSLYGHIFTPAEKLSPVNKFSKWAHGRMSCMTTWIILQTKLQVKCCMVFAIIVRIQGVLCVNEDDFPTWVAILAWQLSSNWTKTTQSILFHLFDLNSVILQIHFVAATFRRLLTHHRVCETAGFSLCGTLSHEIMLAIFKLSNHTECKFN